MWGHVVKERILSGWGSRFTHGADTSEGLTDGQSGEEAILDGLWLWDPLLSGVGTGVDGNDTARRPWTSSRSKNKSLNSPSCWMENT